MASIFDKVWRWVWNTETKYYDGEITRDTDWGGDESTENQPVSGGRVQEWLKNEINGKFGVIRMSSTIDENNFYALEMFATKEDEELYDKDKDAYVDLVTKVTIPISTVQGDAYTAALKTSLKTDANVVITDDNFEVPLNYRSIKISQLGNENAGYTGTLIVERSTDGATWTAVGNVPNVLTSKELDDTDTYQNVKIGQFLAQGRQQVRVRAMYTYVNEEGDTKTVTSSNVMIGASVTKTTLSLELSDDYSKPKYSVDVNNAAVPFSVNYRVNGSVQKTLYLKVTDLKTNTTVTSTFNVGADVDNKIENYGSSIAMTHGVKTVEAWLECADGLGNTIKSDVLVNQLMVVVDTADTTPYLLLQNVDAKIDNFVKTEIAEYAVYSPNTEAEFNLAFLLTDYSNRGQAWKTEYFRLETKVKAQTKNSLLTTVEIEGEDEGAELELYKTYFRVQKIDGTSVSDFILSSTQNSGGREYYSVDVDNTNGFTPVRGATFLMNPKIRNNNEDNPDRIYNVKNNNAVVTSTWENFGFINDGWMTDSAGNKVLRVMAGSKLTIEKDIWAQFVKNPDSALTFEIDCKISNVTNTTDPIIDMAEGSTSFKGLRMNALEGWLMNGTNTSKDDCLFAWQEDVRTHFSININNQVVPNKNDVQFPSDKADQAKGTIALARVLVNGDCVREMKFNTSANDWGTSKIVIGNEGADIDIYSIRIYENKVIDMTDILNRNYLASLPTSEEKVVLHDRNDLMEGGLINVEKTKNKGINTMIWHGRLPYHSEQADSVGWIEIYRYDDKGNYMPEYSGKICEATKSLPAKGQGSTAKTYWDWNLQDDMSKVKDTIQVNVKDIHEEIHVRIEGDKAYIYGGNLGKNAPIETAENEEAYPYANGYVTVPDGWFDGNGKYRGVGYRVAPDTALAQKKVLKINYASSMQSHLAGACTTYDLLHRAVVGNTPLQDLIPDAVSAKHTEPFMFFNENGGETYFKGMGNYGAGKADKIAWGFVKKQMPMFALIEGSDNDPVMTNFLVPFDKNTAVYDVKGEGWTYNGQQSWDFDLGNTMGVSSATGSDGWNYTLTGANDDEAPTALIRDKWAQIHNFIYYCSTNIKFFVGTFDEFKRNKEAEDTKYKYWCTDDFLLRRYDFISGQWINAGVLLGNTYQAINLSTQSDTASEYQDWLQNGNGDYSKLNDAFIWARQDRMKRYLKYFINEKSLLFNYCYVLQFLAGTDNSAKNTYYKIDPIGVQMEENSSFAAWCKARLGFDFDFTSVHQLYLDGDDMDSILRTDNNAHQTKPYYIDRQHPYSDDNLNKCLYEGMSNQLFNFVERAYESSGELENMMNQILTAMVGLVKDNDVLLGLTSNQRSVWGCLHKYFFNIQHYFPQIAYLEQARIRYEFPELLGFISSGDGARNVRPITQSLGSQLQNELQYMNQRLVYFASYAGFGELGSGGGSIGLVDTQDTFSFTPAALPNGDPATYSFTVTPHQYIYPAYAVGQTSYRTRQRTSPKQTCTINFPGTYSGGDAGLSIKGVNYLSDLGAFTKTRITNEVTINGKRLVTFDTQGLFQNTTYVFDPKKINFETPSIKRISISGVTCNSPIDLSKCIKCKYISVRYSYFESVTLPETSNLETLSFGSTRLKRISINNTPNLKTISYGGLSGLMDFSVGDNIGTKTGLSFQPVVESLWTAQKDLTSRNLQSLHVENVNWTDFDVEALSWLADVPTCELKGTISIKEDHPQGLPRVTWDLKNKFLAKFGWDVDNGSTGLKIAYQQRPFVAENARIKGNFYVEGSRQVQFKVEPGSIYENTQYMIQYGGTGDGNGTSWLISSGGYLTVYSLLDKQTFVTIKAVVYAFKSSAQTLTKTIEIWNRPAQVGDLVYADGTFSSKESYDGEKTVIGRCFYVAPKKNGQVNTKLNDPNDKWLRMMVAADDVYVNNANSHQWGVYPLNSDEAHQNSYSLFYLDDNDVRQNLSIDGVSIADIQTITNITSGGLTKQNEAGEWVGTSYIDDASYRDLTDEGYENDGFRMYAQNTAVGDGFGADTAGRVLDDALAKLAGSGYAKGDIVNSSYAKTLKVIHHRNGIISHVQESGEGINGLFPPLDFPTASGSKSELQHLGDLITAVREWAKGTGQGAPGETVNFNKWSQLLYPAASACYAYEPTNLMDGEVLNPKFKAHNWALPTDGILARLFWYTYDGKGNDTAATPKEGGMLDTVTNPNGKVVFKKITTSNLWSVTEYNSYLSWLVYFHNGYTYFNLKNHTSVGRAVSAF